MKGNQYGAQASHLPASVPVESCIRVRRGGHFIFLLLIFAGCFLSNLCFADDPIKGKELFDLKGCSFCHTMHNGKRVGPDLKGVTKKYSDKDLQKWLTDPEAVYKEKGKRPINPGYTTMPTIKLTEKEIDDLIAYIKKIQPRR